MVTNFVGWGGFVWGVVGIENLCCNCVEFYGLSYNYSSIPLEFLIWGV
jgi:hypothetical protein